MMNLFQRVTLAITELNLQVTERAVFRCATCKHSWKCEYIEFEGVLYRPTPNYLYTAELDSTIQRCPNCNSKRIKGGKIVGTVTSKPCNDECLNATKEVCRCSCGGHNHAKGLVSAQ